MDEPLSPEGAADAEAEEEDAAPNAELTPSEYAHLSRGSNAKVNGAIPWVKAFCAETGRTFDDAIICVSGVGGDAKVDHSTFDAFVQWFGIKAEADEEVVIPPECTRPHRRKVSHDKLLTCARWMYNVVNHQLARRGQRGFSATDKFCPTLPSWEGAVAKLARRERDHRSATHTEAESRGDLGVSMRFHHFRDIAIAGRENGLKELQTSFAVSGIRVMGNRSMNMRKGTLRYFEKQSYESLNQGLGMTGLRFKFPDGDKDSSRTKKGKTIVSACLPARNPLLCTIGALGTSYLYRLTALPIPEAFPSISDKASFHQVPLIRGGTTASSPFVTGVDEKRLRVWVSKMFADVGLEREGYDPLIHGLRHHVEQEMAKAPLEKADREKFMARAKDVQDKGYANLIVPPLPQVC